MSILGAAGAIIGGLQIATGARANKKNRQLTRDINTSQLSYGWDMYNQQRKDALADRDYNHPSQIMQRYKEAGLNPNLIYGQGSDGVSVRSSSPGSTSLDVPRNDPGPINQGLETIGAAFSQFVDIQKTQAQTDNLRVQRELIAAEIAAANAGVNYTNSRTETEVYNLDYARGQRDVRQKKEQADLDKTLVDIIYTVNQDERSALKNSADIAKTVQDIAHSKRQMAHELLQMENTKVNRDKILKEIEHLDAVIKLTQNQAQMEKVYLDMRARNLSPNDNGFWRGIIETANRLTERLRPQVEQYKKQQNIKD